MEMSYIPSGSCLLKVYTKEKVPSSTTPLYMRHKLHFIVTHSGSNKKNKMPNLNFIIKVNQSEN